MFCVGMAQKMGNRVQLLSYWWISLHANCTTQQKSGKLCEAYRQFEGESEIQTAYL